MNNELIKIAMKDYEMYRPSILQKLMARKEKELEEAKKSPFIGSGGLLTIQMELEALKRLIKKG